MRHKLLNYSIETDQLVLLEFSDGQNLRVSFDQVEDYLTGSDLIKVKKAIKIRQEFFKHNNLPGTLVVMAVLSLGVFVALDYQRVAEIINGTRPVASPDIEPASAVQAISTPTPSTAVESAAAPAATNPGIASHAAVPAVPAQPASKTQTAVPAVPATPAAPALQAPGLLEPAIKTLDDTSSRLLPKIK